MTNLVSISSIFAFCFAFAALATRRVRDYVVKQNVLDIPNDRSSHKVATPRGGGLALVATFCVTFLARSLFAELPLESAPILFFGALMAGVGWWDDKHHLSAGIRLVAQLIFAFMAVVALGAQFGFLTQAPFLIAGVPLPVGVSTLFLVLFVVWMTNLYNFMDGSDGILGLQTATVALSGAYLSFRVEAPDLGFAYLLLAGSAAGFLVLNWSPAKIFMGDVGSVFCGFVLALLAIVGAATGHIGFATAVILNAMFIGDATVTLFVRLRRKKKPHQAHRSHFYQKMIQAGVSHARVSVVFGVVNIVWLLPIAWAVEAQGLSPWLGLLFAYIVPVGFAWRYHAGVDQPL